MQDFMTAIFVPSSPEHIGIFYFFWMAYFLTVNIVWDIFTKNTEKFHITRMGEKVPVVYNAATFCSSLLLCLAVFEPAARTLAGDTFIVFALAGFSGITQSIGALCPYDMRQLQITSER